MLCVFNTLMDADIFSMISVRKSDKGVDLLASLCDIYETSEDDVRKTMEQTNNVIVDILKKKPCLASECKSENLANINPGQSKYFFNYNC